ncbi:phage tail tape measure protein [Curtobacterium oceanosedimentum]|uniref:phage tail tape measure protein n=1 Tax=Curtobacterium oceanosedimentum TaxID=465820 RepID=UPI0033994114
MANIAVNIVGNDKSASSTMNKVASNAESFGERMHSLGERVAAVFGGLELKEAADKVVDFAKESIEKLSDVASETRSMQRVLGGTPEQVSALDDAAEHMGVSLQSVSAAAGIMSKGIISGKTALTGLGIETKNADGSARSFTDLLPDIAEKFHGMTDSTQRTALAMQLFGRGGKDLLPLLMQGKDGIADLEEEAKRLGVTIDGKTMDATWKFQQAQKTLQTAVEGVQMKLGTALYPTLIRVANFLSSNVVPAIESMFEWVQRNGPTMLVWARNIGIVVAALGAMLGVAKFAAMVEELGSVGAAIMKLTGLTKLWAVAQAALDLVMDANPITLIILGVMALIAAVALIVANWNVIGPWLQGLWTTILGFLTGVWNQIVAVAMTVWNGVVAFFQQVIAVIVDVFLHWTLLGIIISHMSQIQAGIVAVWSAIVGFFAAIPGRIVAFFDGALSWLVGVGSWILSGLLNGAAAGWGAVSGWFGGIGSRIGGFFAGATSWLERAGENVIQGLINGIGGAAGWLKDQISNVVGGITSWAKSLLGIHSPSTVFHEIGQNVGQGFANGIAAMHGVARTAMTGLVATPDVDGMGLTKAVSGRNAAAVTQQAATRAGGIYVGAINMPTASPQQLDTELGWRNRWGI